MALLTNKYQLGLSVERTQSLLIQFLKAKEITPQEVTRRGRSLWLDQESFERELLRNAKKSQTLCKKLIAYCCIIRQGRWPAYEELLLTYSFGNTPFRYLAYTSPDIILMYCQMVVKERWPEVEHLFERSPILAVRYALTVIRGRWEEAESYILLHHPSAVQYAIEVLRSRWDRYERWYDQGTRNRYTEHNFRYDFLYRQWFNLPMDRRIQRIKKTANWHKEGF